MNEYTSWRWCAIGEIQIEVAIVGAQDNVVFACGQNLATQIVEVDASASRVVRIVDPGNPRFSENLWPE